jgi:hypothetical protein
MSPQPSRADKSPREPLGVGDELVWGEGPRSIALPKHLMAQIWAQVYQGMRALARGGLEVGGLLVGPKADGGRVVDGIIPLPIEYRRGPSFRMSSSDLASLVSAIESVQGDPVKAVVGFYRSRTRGDGTLRESDREIFDTIERAHLSYALDFRCCLVLAPMSESVALACIALRSGDGWDEMHPFTLRSDLESISTLPSSTSLLRMPRTPDKETRLIDSRVSLPAVEPVTDESVHEQRAVSLAAGGSSAWRARNWLYAAVCLALAGGAAGSYRWAVRKQPQPTGNVRTQIDAPRAHLGFSATLEGSVWKLAWDRAAMDALNPIAAVLSIEDGGYTQEVPLAPADLTSGTIFYTPQNSNLTFRLRIDRGGEQIEEHVRVLGAPPIAQTPVDRLLQSAPQKAPVQARAHARGVTLPSERAHTRAAQVPAASADPKPNPSIPGTVTSTEPTLASATGRDVKSATTPVSASTAAAIAIPVPPSVETRANLALTSEPTAKPAPDMTPSRAPTDQQTIGVPAAGAVSPPEGARTAVERDANELKEGPPDLVTIPRVARPNAPARANYLGPKPIRQVRPQVPGNMPSGVSQVQVLVEIDPHGKVVKVTPVAWTATNAPLMILAERAAASWVFDPAQLEGHAVSSQMNLTFRFRF